MLKKWSQLPKKFHIEEIKPYYLVLCGKLSDLAVKRVMDVVLATMMLVMLSPILIVLAVLIKLDSKGPVFYRQERVTQYGKTYRIFKFRTMVTDADKQGPLVTEAGDSRITKMGNLLRKCRLDELPQLINIITGDMTFVGTRPEVQRYVDAYTPEMMATLLLPAGVTSIASIRYKDEDEVLERLTKEEGMTVDEAYITEVLPDKMKYNLEYLENFSVLGDLKIMIETVIAVSK